MILSVKQQGLDEMRRIATEVSDPDHESYTNYLVQAQIDEITKPLASDMAAVTGWLQASGVAFEAGHHTVTVTCTVAQCERMFATKFHHLRNEQKQEVVRATAYSLPTEVSASLDAVFGIHGLPLPLRNKYQPPRPAMPANVTPEVINADYGSPDGIVPAGTKKNRQAVAEFQGQFMNETDLVTFFKNYVPSAKAGQDKVSKFVGGEKNGMGIEAELDIQYMMGVSPGVQSEFWEFKNMDFCGDLKNWTTALLADDDVPFVHSISYGWQGNLTQIQCKDAESSVVDADFVKLAAKGIAIIFASGDSGSGYAGPACDPKNPGKKGVALAGKSMGKFKMQEAGECCQIGAQGAGWTFLPAPDTTADAPKEGTCTVYKTVSGQSKQAGAVSGGESVDPKPPTLYPSWPASSQWVTAVGATRFQGQKVGNAEMAVDQFGSGGGFSRMFDAPAYQKEPVAAYLKNAPQLPPTGSYPPGGRATPDVSALGEGFQVVGSGSVLAVGGTSASTPMFSGLISLLNDARLQAGKKQLGFLNPWIYKNPDMFTDITVGTNAIGRGGGQALPYGWNCTKGWDPATGLGTPIFKKMKTAALAGK